jgi:hypothetical protein
LKEIFWEYNSVELPQRESVGIQLWKVAPKECQVRTQFQKIALKRMLLDATSAEFSKKKYYSDVTFAEYPRKRYVGCNHRRVSQEEILLVATYAKCFRRKCFDNIDSRS